MLFFRITIPLPSVLSAVDFDYIADRDKLLDNFEGFFFGQFALHTVRCGVGVALISAFEKIADGVERLIKGIERAGEVIPIAFGKIVAPPAQGFAAPLLRGVLEDFWGI